MWGLSAECGEYISLHRKIFLNLKVNKFIKNTTCRVFGTSVPYMFFFLQKNVFFDQFLIEKWTQKNLKKGLKKGERWFRMELSGKEWRLVEKSRGDVELTLRERIPDVIRRV